MRLSRTLQTLAEAYKQDHMIVVRHIFFDTPVDYCEEAYKFYSLNKSLA
jgi:hypothetical protein